MKLLTDFELRTMPGLYRGYEASERQLSFDAQSEINLSAWQASLREVLLRLLGGFPVEACALDPQLIERAEETGIIRELIVIQTQPGEYMPCSVLIPRNAAPPYKPVIALHGHGTWGAKSIIGVADSDLEIQFIHNFNMDYGLQLANAGYLVFAPLLRGFAERMENSDRNGDGMWQSSCKTLSVSALLLGKTLLGLRIRDVLRLIDYIRLRPEPTIENLACVGFSGGGTLALFTAALTDKITCIYLSGCLNTFRDSLMAVDHCICNYLPGILQYMEMADVAGLIAPRPLFVEAGKNDPIYPLTGTQKALDSLRRIYKAADAEARLESYIFEGAHEWDGRLIFDWLARFM